MKRPRQMSTRVRALRKALSLVIVSAPPLLVAQEFLNPVGALANHGSSIESFEWKGEHLYVWDGHAFKIFRASDWPEYQLLGEVDIGSPVMYASKDRIETIGSKANLYDAEPVWILNSDDTLTAPPLYRHVIDVEDPMAPSV